MKKEITKQGHNEVIIHQDVARLRGRLSVTQSKCMLSILKRANEQAMHNKDIKVFSIPTEVLLSDIQDKDTAGLETVVQKLEKHLRTLMTQIFQWGTAEELNMSIFMQQIKITTKEVEFTFSDYIREHIKPLSNALIVRDFTLIQSFRSEYARQLYKHLMMWEKQRCCYITVKDLRDFLGVPDTSSYKRMEALKRKVLNVAVDEINEKCPYMDLKYTNRTKPRSRTIEGFNFGWFNKPQEPKKTPKLINDDVSEEEQINVLIDRKIYVQDKLFFFTGLVLKEGKYQICVEDTNKQKALVPTINVSVDGALETVKKMMEDKETK